VSYCDELVETDGTMKEKKRHSRLVIREILEKNPEVRKVFYGQEI